MRLAAITILVFCLLTMQACATVKASGTLEQGIVITG